MSTDQTTAVSSGDDPIYTPAEVEFMLAMQAHKKRTGRRFPTWAEVLNVLMSLGYIKPEAVAAEAA